MKNEPVTHADDLNAIIDQKVTALIREMENADWSADEVALAIQNVIQNRWLSKTEALRAAREAVPKNFVSDGNEG